MKKMSLPRVFGIAAAALALLLAAVVPALLLQNRAKSEPLEPLSTAERAALFALYWAEDARCSVELVDAETVDEAERASGRESILSLQDQTCFDRGVRLTENTGERFYILCGEDGRGLRMREYYEQSTGDWSNWFRVFADMDTGEIYFLYQSCKCLKHTSLYPPREIITDAAALAQGWTERIGYDHCAVLETTDNSARAAYVRGNGALYYDMSYTAYTTPEYVVDFRIMMQPPEAEG